jgi:hypothetical protein
MIKADVRHVALYALLAFLVLPVFPHFSSPNEFTRWALVAAAVEDHCVEVSAVVPILGVSFFEDLAVIHGRQYSNKAPGLALASAPGYLLARPIAGPPARANLRLVLTAMRWFGATLPLLAMALLFGRVARERGAECSEFAVAVLLFGTPLFTYGLLLFSHALVASALFAAWVLLYLRDRGGVAAGALIGIAVMSEYPIVIGAIVLLAGLAATRQWKRLALTAAGGAPFAILLGIYHTVAFGGPFIAPYSFDKLPQYRQLGGTGVFGLQLPSLRIAAETLVHPARGLLLFSPILLLCVAAFPHAKRALPRAAFATLVAMPAAIFLIYSGYPNWHGGWNVGPRYVTAILPFLVFPLAFGRIGRWTVAMFGASVAAVMLTTLVFPFVPLDFPLPWGTLATPLLLHGLVAPNLLHLVWRPLAVALPLIAIAAAVMTGAPRRTLLVAMAGAVVMLLAGVAAMQVGARLLRPLVIRAVFEDIYFERRGTLDKLVAARIASPSLLRRRALQWPAGPESWPF